MATGAKDGLLTNREVVRLAASISANDMAAIAEGYMSISPETIKNIKFENKDDAQAFNRGIIRQWAYMNPDKQIQVTT